MVESIWVVYRIKHFFFLLPPFRVSRAARVACSNTSLTPSFVLAEHSRYLVAPIFLRTSSAWDRESVFRSCLLAALCCVLIRDCDAYLFRGNGLLRCLVQLLNGLLVVSQILLAANEDDGQAGAEVQDLGNPLEKNDSVSVCSPRESVTHDAIAARARERVIYLLLDVVQRIGRVDGEANEDDM